MAQFKNSWLVYFAAINALLAAIITSSIVPGELLFSLSKGSLFLSLALPGHFFFLALLLYLPLFLVGKFLLPSQKLVIPAAIIFALFVAIIFINATVFGLYRFHLNGMVLNLMTSGEALQILSISLVTWAILIIGLLVLLAIEYFVAIVLYRYFSERNHGAGVLWLVAILVMLLGQSYYAYSDAGADREVTSMVRYIPWAQPLTAKRRLRQLGIKVAKAEDNYIGEVTGSSLHYPKNPLQCVQDSTHRPNIVILVVDSLRFDMQNDKVMPNAYALVDSSWLFTDHISTGNATRFGIFGLLYGLPGSYWHSMAGEQRGTVLIDILLEQQYQLFLNAAASWSFPEFDRTVFAGVKDQLVSGKKIKQENRKDKRHRDTIVTDDFVQKILNRDDSKPFFGVLFLDAPHNYSMDKSASAPFQPALKSVNYLELDNDYEPTEFFNRYKNSVHYNDALIGEVVDTLEQQSLLDETVLVITGDHAQEFNDTRQNYWGHNGNFSPYQTRVPMVIRWPGVASNSIDHRTSHEDVVPTLMQRALGCQNPVGDYSTGQDLYSSAYRSRPLLLESWSARALMTDERIFYFGPSGDTQIYDFENREITDGVTDSAAILDAMNRMGEFYK
jgi:membrane-anchored protein YejM (alkaline phosphatase superfamily)